MTCPLTSPIPLCSGWCSWYCVHHVCECCDVCVSTCLYIHHIPSSSHTHTHTHTHAHQSVTPLAVVITHGSEMLYNTWTHTRHDGSYLKHKPCPPPSSHYKRTFCKQKVPEGDVIDELPIGRDGGTKRWDLGGQVHCHSVRATPFTVSHKSKYVVEVRLHAAGFEVHGVVVCSFVFPVNEDDHHNVISNVPLAFQLQGEREGGREGGRVDGVADMSGQRRRGVCWTCALYSSDDTVNSTKSPTRSKGR